MRFILISLPVVLTNAADDTSRFLTVEVSIETGSEMLSRYIVVTKSEGGSLERVTGTAVRRWPLVSEVGDHVGLKAIMWGPQYAAG